MLPQQEIVIFKLFGLNGELVKQWQIEYNSDGINQFNFLVKGFPNGMYFLQLHGTKHFITKKIVISHK